MEEARDLEHRGGIRHETMMKIPSTTHGTARRTRPNRQMGCQEVNLEADKPQAKWSGRIENTAIESLVASLPDTPTRSNQCDVHMLDAFALGQVMITATTEQARKPRSRNRGIDQSQTLCGDHLAWEDAENVAGEGIDVKFRVPRARTKAERKRLRHALDKDEYNDSTNSAAKKGRFESPLNKEAIEQDLPGKIIHQAAVNFAKGGE